MPNKPRWIIDTASPDLSGLLIASGGEYSPSGTLLVSNDTMPREIQLLTNTPTEQLQPLDVTGGSLKASIGDALASPAGGTFTLDYGGVATGPINPDSSETDLSSLLNNNANITTAGGVDVEKSGNSFIVIFRTVGVKSLLTVTLNALVPLATITPYRAQTGAAAVREIQVLTMERNPYATYTGWAVGGAVAGSITAVSAGSATAFAVFRVALSATSSGGSASLTYGKSHVYDIKTAANTGIKANGQITCVDGSALNDKFFDLPGAASAIVRFWFNVSGGGTAPAIPAGGSVSAITTVLVGDTNLAVAAKVAAAIEAHADFTSTAVGGAVITWAAAAYGVKTTVAADGDTGFGVMTISQGNSGQLDQTAFIIHDEIGSIGVWFDGAGAGATGYPAAAAAADRQLRVVVAAGDTAAAVATALEAVLTADSKLTATVSGSLVRTTVDAVGLCEEPTDLSPAVSGFTVESNTDGDATTAQIPFGATAATIQGATENFFKVVAEAPNKWVLTAAAKGALTTPTLSETGLTQPTYFSGAMPLTDSALLLALATTDADELVGILEVEWTDASANKSTVLQLPVRIVRDIIT